MDPAFEVHKLNSRGMQKAKRLASNFDTHLSIVREIVGEPYSEGGLMYKCIEHLELASFYAKKTLAQQPGNQDLGNEAEAEAPFAALAQDKAGPTAFTGTVGGFLGFIRGMKFTKFEADRLMKAIADQTR